MHDKMGMKQNYNTLFIGASFFGYAKAIVSELEKRGHKTIWFEDRPGIDTLTKAILRVSPALIQHKTESYFDSIIEQLRGEPIQHVFVVKGEALSVPAIGRLRATFPNARFTLYFWDSYRNMPRGSAEKVPLFDRAFTFDPVDARADNRLKYRPLFYLPDFATLPDVERDIDILFIGTVHSDRYAVLKQIEKAIPHGLGFTQMLYYPSRSLYRVKRIFRRSFWGAPSGNTIFKPLTRQEIISLIARASVIVDIERSVQAGYTIRTIETIAAGRKLITTNPKIQDADFYQPSNHLYIDRENPTIEADFFSKPIKNTSSDVITRYSLNGWLNDIFEEESMPSHQDDSVVQMPIALQ